MKIKLTNKLKQLMGPISMGKRNTMDVNAAYKLVTHILQNILFCNQQKKNIHTGLEQLKVE